MSSDYGLKRGTMIGPYRIIRLIGRGGMGEVYEAFEEGLNRRVAIKMILKEHLVKPDVKQRFEIEGRALAQIIHPNVVTVHSLGHYEGAPYLAMEFVEGITLSEYLKKRVFPVKEVLPLFSQLLNGVQALHANKIIHRDLKPNNIIYQSNHVVKIVDFGVAKMLEEMDVEITGKGTVIGSAKYISPEGARGEITTLQSDIWSLGVLFYQMLIGHTPFDDTTYLKVLNRVKNDPIRMPMFAKMMIPKEIRTMILTMLQRDLDSRYQSTEQVSHELEKYMKAHEKDIRRPRTQENLATLHLNIKNERKIYTKLKNSGYDNFRAKMILTLALNEQAKLENTRTQGTQENTHSDLTQSHEITISEQAMAQAIRAIEQTGTQSGFKDRRKKPRQELAPGNSSSSQGIFIKTLAASIFVGLLFIGFKSLWLSQNNPFKKWQKTEQSSTKPKIETLPITIPKASPPKYQQPQVEIKPPPRITKPKPIPPSRPKTVKIGRPILRKTNHKGIYYARPPVIEWSKVKTATRYQVSIATDKSFKKLVENKFVRRPVYVGKSLKRGEYYYRIQGWNNNSSVGPASLIGKISVFLDTPRLRRKYSASRTVAELDDPGEGYSISRTFTRVRGASGYEIMASRSKSFGGKVKKSRTKKARFSLQLKSEGKYYVKVAALDSKGRVAGSYSKVAVVEYSKSFNIAAPVPQSPLNGKNIGRGPASTEFSWSPVGLAKDYEFQISLSQDFVRPFIKETVTAPRFEVSNNLPIGTVYWRVRAWRNRSKSPWSDPQRVVVPPPREE